MIRVALDYTPAIRQGAGVGRHTRSLAEAMLAQNPPDIQFSFFYASGDLSSQQMANLHLLKTSLPAGVNLVSLPFSELTLVRAWQRLRLPIPFELVTAGKMARQQVLHFPNFVVPPLLSGKTIVTIHDLSFLVVPQYADQGLQQYLSSAVPRAVRKADRVIVVSESIKQELVERCQTDPAKISVIYNGVGDRFRPLDDPEKLESVRERLKLPARFALFVGTIEPRKNIARLAEAWAQVKQTPEGKDIKLVLAGKRGWLYEPIFTRISELKLQDEIVWLDFVPDPDLPALYNLAELFVYPSLYEGFGIPPLEALACGTPVVTARNSALTEVFEGAALLSDASEAEAITGNILTILRSQETDRKLVGELREKGLARAQRFSWEKAAATTIDLYRELA